MHNVVRTSVILAGLSWLMLLTGCASMNNSFDCPLKSATRCESLDQVNTRIDRKEIGSEAGSGWKSPDPVWHAATGEVTPENPMRHPETIQQVWVAPYEDSQGNYHGESSVYAVMTPGFWHGPQGAGERPDV